MCWPQSSETPACVFELLRLLAQAGSQPIGSTQSLRQWQLARVSMGRLPVSPTHAGCWPSLAAALAGACAVERVVRAWWSVLQQCVHWCVCQASTAARKVCIVLAGVSILAMLTLCCGTCWFMPPARYCCAACCGVLLHAPVCQTTSGSAMSRVLLVTEVVSTVRCVLQGLMAVCCAVLCDSMPCAECVVMRVRGREQHRSISQCMPVS